MRRLVSVLLIAVLAVAGYNYYQIGKIRQELREMSADIELAQSSREKAGDGDLLAALDEAKRHSVRARQLMASGKTKQAKTELDESLRMIEKASELSRISDAGEPGTINQAWDRVRVEIEKAWKDMSSQAKKRGPD